MQLNDILIVCGIAVFVIPVVYLMGYARRESQHGKIVQDCKDNVTFQRQTLSDMHNAEQIAANSLIRELEISLLQAGEAIELVHQGLEKMTKQWKYADGYRKVIVEMLLNRGLWDFVKHSDVPANMLQILLDDAAKHAIDPAVNQKAKNLITRGVRKGAKQGREQMRKLMQKSIDNQALTIQSLSADLNAAHEEWDSLLSRKTIAQQALVNVMADKMPIRSIRKAFRIAVLNERGRLTELAKKGE